MIESKTPAGQPERIVTWAAHDSDHRLGVDYEYRKSFHPWFPVAIKPFITRHRTQEFYVRSLKMGGSPLSQDNFFPTQFTNANTLTILHTKGGMEFFDGGRKLNLVQTRQPPQTNMVAPSASAAPTNAPLPSPPSANKGLSLAPAPPPSRLFLIAAVVCLSVPLLLLIFFTIRSNKSGTR